jgi:sugar lactone lactonase YvrE
MREIKVASAALALIIGVLAAVSASAWNRLNSTITILATLPALVDNNGQTALRSGSEGITVGSDNNIYVASSGNSTVPGNSPSNLFVITPNGTFLNNGAACNPPNVPCSVRITNSSAFALGLRFNRTTGRLWVLDLGNAAAGQVPRILNVNSVTGEGTPFSITFQANASLNALTFDGAGNGYVSDSALGRIYRVTPNGDSATIWSAGGGGGDPLLFPAQVVPPVTFPPGEPGLVPPFGANGIEFLPPGCIPGVGQCVMIVANTANRQILQIASDANGNAMPATVFVNSINGPDGIAINPDTNDIYVASNQSNEIVVITSTTGRAIAKLGDFNGIDGQGRALGFLFPTSLAFGNPPPPPGGQRMLYVTNLASLGAATPSIDTSYISRVTNYTVSQLPVPTIPVGGLF